MQPGALYADRFEIVRIAGTGGMGSVYRAIDRTTNAPVALKVLRPDAASELARFRREARVLSELRHPGIVRYVAHGVASDGQAYLAMEWLDGEDLGQRLVRAPLSLRESVTLLERVAAALAAAHACGIVHRDIKPRNLFLPDGRIESVRVIDFGIARVNHSQSAVTREGSVVGTLGYMAPEQARGDEGVDPRADVFALGCVAFECFSGQPAFRGETAMAVLAKILMAEAPRLSIVWPGIPAAIDDLVSRMLSKARVMRPRDGRAVLDELVKLGPIDDGARPPASGRRVEALTEGERRLVFVVLARPPEARGPAVAALAPTTPMMAWPDTAPGVITDTAVTAEAAAVGSSAALVRAALDPYEARCDTLADGSLVVTVPGSATAIDQAARAARCALTLSTLLPDWRIALAIGRGDTAASIGTMGAVIDRAAVLLRGDAAAGLGSSILLDEVTAALLDVRFEVQKRGGTFVLARERSVSEGTRTLLGKPTRFVGRERELAYLETLWREAQTERRACAVVVTAPPGAGKSRLARELVAVVRTGAAAPPTSVPSVWFARGDPMSAGSAFALLAPVIRELAGIRANETLSVRQQKLLARVGRVVRASERDRIAALLGELIETPMDDAVGVELAGARLDPNLLTERMRRAWEEFLEAECAVSPVLLVVEDVHWGDLPSLEFIDAGLRAARRAPLMVLALGRPEVSEAFPNLWAERDAQVIRIGKLSPNASAELARDVLGPAVKEETVAAIVERADGNAFYLEELIRAVAEGSATGLPETVLAMLEARLVRLGPVARRTLRAASIFGPVFWKSGIEALIGGSTSDLGRTLVVLVTDELICRRAEPRFPGEEEFEFRHALLYEAVSAMLTADDRALGHRLAANWLERVGETDAIVLAEHFDRGQCAQHAAACYARAASEALEASDFVGAIAHAQKAIDRGAAGDDLVRLRIIQADANQWRANNGEAARCASMALALAPKESNEWAEAAEHAIAAWARLGQIDRVMDLASAIEARFEATAEASRALLSAAVIAVQHLAFAGRLVECERVLARVEEHAASIAQSDFTLLARIEATRAGLLVLDAPLEALPHIEAAARLAARAGDERMACRDRSNMSFVKLRLGLFDDAARDLESLIEMGEKIESPIFQVNARLLLGRVRLAQKQPEAACALQREAIALALTTTDTRLACACRTFLAEALLAMGDVAGAERESRLAIEAPTAGVQANAFAMRARVLLAGGGAREALAAANEAMTRLEASSGIDIVESLIRLAHAEALEASGAHAEARAAIARARDRIEQRARTIGDAAIRRRFLEDVPENARTLELARVWLAPVASA